MVCWCCNSPSSLDVCVAAYVAVLYHMPAVTTPTPRCLLQRDFTNLITHSRGSFLSTYYFYLSIYLSISIYIYIYLAPTNSCICDNTYTRNTGTAFSIVCNCTSI